MFAFSLILVINIKSLHFIKYGPNLCSLNVSYDLFALRSIGKNADDIIIKINKLSDRLASKQLLQGVLPSFQAQPLIFWNSSLSRFGLIQRYYFLALFQS